MIIIIKMIIKKNFFLIYPSLRLWPIRVFSLKLYLGSIEIVNQTNRSIANEQNFVKKTGQKFCRILKNLKCDPCVTSRICRMTGTKITKNVWNLLIADSRITEVFGKFRWTFKLPSFWNVNVNFRPNPSPSILFISQRGLQMSFILKYSN